MLILSIKNLGLIYIVEIADQYFYKEIYFTYYIEEVVMGVIEFDDTMLVNIKHIDEQHKKLIDILNRLRDAMKAGSGKEALEEVLTDLAAYVEYHFKSEEDLFKKYNYPDSTKHIEEHKSYIENIGKFNEKFNQNKTLGLSVEVLNYLVSWVKHHIMEVDKKYSEFFNARGVN